MTIPNFQDVLRPALATLADGEVHRSRDIKDQLADEFSLTTAERAQLLPSGRVRTMDSRVGWALTYLFQAGLTHRPRRGTVAITSAGRDALVRYTERISTKDLEQFAEFREFQTRSGTTPTNTIIEPARPRRESADVDLTTPDELIAAAAAGNRAAIESELAARLQAVTPTEFEDVVMRLLFAMGYGEAGSVERTSASGDAGIDGIISQDPLGLDRIYVQAKRYADHRVIHRPTIQEFAGALQYRQGDRGVFITTSRFSSGAIEAAERINARIELIDGHRLAGLMMENGVGVQPEQSVTLYRLDEDFFESL